MSFVKNNVVTTVRKCVTDVQTDKQGKNYNIHVPPSPSEPGNNNFVMSFILQRKVNVKNMSKADNVIVIKLPDTIKTFKK